MYLELIPKNERDDLLGAYDRQLTAGDPDEMMYAARMWTKWEFATGQLIRKPIERSPEEADRFALVFARSEAHYFKHGASLRHDNQLIEDVPSVRRIPTVIVHGRYDIVCPVEDAWELHRAWPQAELRIVPDADHSMYERGIRSELIIATDAFAR